MIKNRILAVSQYFCWDWGARLPRAKDTPETQPTEAQVEREAEEMLGRAGQDEGIPDARSNTTLGPSREAPAFVIDERGHIVTIGYIRDRGRFDEITTQDDRTVSATLIGYDTRAASDCCARAHRSG